MSEQSRPLACTLEEKDFRDRLPFIGAEVVEKVRAVEELPEGYALRFDAEPEMRQTLQEFVDFERQCCASLQFELSESSGEITLQVTGGSGTKSALREILPQLQAQVAPRRRWLPRRLGGSAAVATAAALVICDLPFLLVFFGLASTAEWFGFWDAAGVAVVAAGLIAWIWRRRRSRPSTEIQG